MRGARNAFLRLVPVGIVQGDEHAAVADREDVDFAFDDFVDDAIGFDDQLVKSLGIRRDAVVALDGNGLMREGEVAESVGCFSQLHLPANAAFGKQLGRQTRGTKAKTDDWFEAFSRLDKALRGRGRTVVLLDEISWMGKYDPMFAGELKQAWDNWFSKRPKVIVFLCGSVSAWIDKNIVKSKAFVGRPSMNLTLRELPMNVCSAFWGRQSARMSTREMLDVLSVTGGVPEYLENVDPAISAIQTSKGVYCVEIKRQNSIGERVVKECEEKMDRLKVKRSRTVRWVLVYDGDLSKRVPADAFFSFIVSADRLMGRA